MTGSLSYGTTSVTDSKPRRAVHRRRWSRWRVIAVLVVLSVTAVGWAILAPVSLGGRADYLITDGISMLPRIHGGALVITLAQSHYHLGEVAAYFDPQLRTVVLHRIVGIRAGRYIFKGDNNSWLDSSRGVPLSDLIGAAEVYSPWAGRVVMDLRIPANFAVLMGLLGLFAFWGWGSRAGGIETQRESADGKGGGVAVSGGAAAIAGARDTEREPEPESEEVLVGALCSPVEGALAT